MFTVQMIILIQFSLINNIVRVLLSFGMVLWEIYTCQTPFDDQELSEYYDDFVDMICVRQVRPGIPADCPPKWRDIMRQCWSGDSHVRPLFKDIVRRLDEMRGS